MKSSPSRTDVPTGGRHVDATTNHAQQLGTAPTAQHGDNLPPTIRCEATDAEASTMLGDGPAEAVFSGAASDLALRLWNRPHGAPAGDGEAFVAWTSAPIISPLD